MTKNALRIALIVGILAVASGYFLMTRRQPIPAAPAEVTVTGNYSDDWQSACGPLLGPAQADCTAHLDARYGRVAGAPLPPAKGAGR